jgi:hypothetical protein
MAKTPPCPAAPGADSLTDRIVRVCEGAQRTGYVSLDQRRVFARRLALRLLGQHADFVDGIHAAHTCAFEPVVSPARPCAVCGAAAAAVFVALGEDDTLGMNACTEPLPACVAHCACLGALVDLVALPLRTAQAAPGLPRAPRDHIDLLLRVLATW